MRERVNIFAKFSRLLAGLLLLIFASYYANITLFTHTHTIDGATIVHSHFHSDNHTSSNESEDNRQEQPAHTRNELTLVKALSHFLIDAPIAAIFATIVLVSGEWCYQIISERAHIIYRYAHPQLRAPPFAV